MFVGGLAGNPWLICVALQDFYVALQRHCMARNDSRGSPAVFPSIFMSILQKLAEHIKALRKGGVYPLALWAKQMIPSPVG